MMSGSRGAWAERGAPKDRTESRLGARYATHRAAQNFGDQSVIAKRGTGDLLGRRHAP